MDTEAPSYYFNLLTYLSFSLLFIPPCIYKLPSKFIFSPTQRTLLRTFFSADLFMVNSSNYYLSEKCPYLAFILEGSLCLMESSWLAILFLQHFKDIPLSSRFLFFFFLILKSAMSLIVAYLEVM